jgi:DNA ligase-associated metallophosphoesterase
MRVRFTVADEELMLLSDRAAFWPRRNALFVADLHIGKATAFRAERFAVPAGSSEETLARLSRVLLKTGARKLFVLGDFWHAKNGRDDRIYDLLFSWRQMHPDIEMVLVEGNHDVRAGAMPPDLDIREEKELTMDGFVLKHHPAEDEKGYVLSGHIHPAVRLIGQGRQEARLPAFWFGPNVGVLPAFGEFTGFATVYPAAGDQVYVVADDDVLQVGLTGAGVL